MPHHEAFTGFSRGTVAFFTGLKKHNEREWFEAHRAEYETDVMAPARRFVTALGERLRELSPALRYEPKMNGSLFRIYRDTRFSADKTPYKTNLGIYFWEGGGSRLECSGYYVHLQPPDFGLGTGVYMFSPEQLKQFRHTAVHPEYGYDLLDIVTALSSRSNVEIGGRHYKRFPAGSDAAHPNAGLLLHNALYAWHETSIPGEFYTPQLVDYCYRHFAAATPLHRWLVNMISGRFRD